MTKIEAVAEIKKIYQACWLAGLDADDTAALVKAFLVNVESDTCMFAVGVIHQEATIGDFRLTGEFGETRG